VLNHNKGVKALHSTLWDGYAQVLAGYYRIPLMVMAIRNGWHPPFLFKNVVVQEDYPGYYLTINSCAQEAKTGI
jgi:hypothetical protein